MEIVAGVATRLHVHPSGVNAFDCCDRVGIRNFYFEVDVVIRGRGGIVDHGLDADFVSLLHAVGVAGNFLPVSELAAGAEKVLLLIGA